MPVEQFNRFFLVSCKPLNIPGLSAPRYIHVATDVTEQRQFADKLQAINQQKELLIQELFHRTKNNMQMINSMLRLYGSRFTDAQAREATRNIEIKIQTMSLIHQKLFDDNDLCNIKLDDFFRSLVAMIKQQYSPRSAKVLFILNIQPVMLNIDMANPLALVINELITNAIRHAFPLGTGEIRLSLIQEDDQLKINIQDTGIGILEDTDLQTSTSLGMMLVYSQIIDQLHGSISYTSNNGLHWNISLPISEQRPRF
jgi:two-component sensor histidine kinase